MRVLVVDDDKAVCNLLEASLESEFVVDSTQDSVKGSYYARTNDYDLVLLDNHMPGKNGDVVCREIRTAGKTMPIIVLSAVTNTEAKVDLLDAGADDYMAKPFSIDELIARMRALLRRPVALLQEILEIDTLSLNTRTHVVRRGDSEPYLTRKEFMLLEYLMRHQDSVMSRGMLMEHVWNMSVDPFSNTVESHIVSLRKKIERKGHRKLIHTIPGRGYKIGLAGTC